MNDSDLWIIEAGRAVRGLHNAQAMQQERAAGQEQVAVQAITAQSAYQAWLNSDEGQAAEQDIRAIRLHMAFDAGWASRDEWLRHEREWQVQSNANHDVDL